MKPKRIVAADSAIPEPGTRPIGRTIPNVPIYAQFSTKVFPGNTIRKAGEKREPGQKMIAGPENFGCSAGGKAAGLLTLATRASILA